MKNAKYYALFLPRLFGQWIIFLGHAFFRHMIVRRAREYSDWTRWESFVFHIILPLTSRRGLRNYLEYRRVRNAGIKDFKKRVFPLDYRSLYSVSEYRIIPMKTMFKALFKDIFKR